MAFAALSAGVSGMTTFTEGIDVISNNITNVNTTGFKETRNRFSTLVTETESVSDFSPGGVTNRAQTLVSEQGLLQSTGSPTDLGIDGDGFFVTKSGAQAESNRGNIEFTRAGNFTPNDKGFLQNTSGNFLMGFPMDSQGNITTNIGDVDKMEPINVSGLTGTAEATSEVGLRMNLRSSLEPETVSSGELADGTKEPDFAQTIEIFDAQGGSHPLTVAAAKTEENTFRVEIFSQDPDAINQAQNGVVLSGKAKFNDDGSIASFEPDTPSGSEITPSDGDPVAPQADVDFNNGAGTETVSFDLGNAGQNNGLTQFDSASTLISSSVDGAVFGNVIATEVSEDGVVTARFDNGLSRDVFQLPVATFPNPDGLTRLQGNNFGPSNQSGDQSIVLPGEGGAGTIAPSTLEDSTVDLSEEFANLIETQRGFSASARVVSTSDEVLEELVRVI